jgi:hypothetical protein
MVRPKSGDVLVRDAIAGCAVVDAVTLRQLAGPFHSVTEAVFVARELARTGHVWRENHDVRGRAINRPFPLELQPSTLA